jgi:hypothetical protein
MKKFAVLLMLAALMLGSTTYRGKEVAQNWKFDSDAILDKLDPLSGKWEVQSTDKVKTPSLTQTVKYADYPKVLLKDNQFYDFDVATKIYVSSENPDVQAGGLILRYRNLYSFYMLFLNAKDKRLTLTRAGLGGMKVVKRQNYNVSPDQWYELKVRCYLDHIQAFVDGEPVLDANDQTSTGGKIGLVTAGASKVFFDGLDVRAQAVEVTRTK